MEQKQKNIERGNLLFNNTIIFAISIFGTKILTLLLLPLYTSVLTTGQYGQIDITMTINSLLPYFLTICISDAVLRFAIDNKRDQIKILTLGIKVISIGYCVLIAAVSTLYLLNVINANNKYLLFVLLLFPFDSFRTLFSSYLKAVGKTKDILIESLLTTLLTIGFTIISIVYFKLGVMGYLASQVLGLAAGCFYYLLRIRKVSGKVLEFGLNKTIKKQMIFYSLPLILNGVSWWINSGSDKFIITLFCGEAENGIYAIAGKIPAILTLITSVFAQSWTLSAFKARGDDDYDSFFSSIYNKYNAFLLMGASVLILLNQPLARILYSNEFFVANQTSSILIVAVLFNSLAGCLSGAFSAFNNNKVVAITTIVAAVTNLAMNFLLIPNYGGVGAAVATTVSFIVLWVLRLILSRKNVKIKINILPTIITYLLLLTQVVCDHVGNRLYLIQLLILIFILIINHKHIFGLVKVVLNKVSGFAHKRKCDKEYDFLLLYEVKNRELETVCLLKYELERRGYSVIIRETWRNIHYPYNRVKARVIITFALYNNSQIKYISEFAVGVEKIINLQWEQLYTIADELDSKGLYTIKELAVKATHICWGEYSYNNLRNKSNISDYNLILTGQPSFDFSKSKFNSYFMTRDELLKSEGLDTSKKVYLFISSFSYVDMSDEALSTGVYAQLTNNALDFKEISAKSQIETFNWISGVLERYPDIYFIYRPHPAEIGNELLTNLASRYENFRIIRNYSVKQWIKCCDKIYTWYSTSIAEIYLEKKCCRILRPYPIDDNNEIRIYKNGKFITTREEFECDYTAIDNKFPLDEGVLRHYYKFDNEYAYIKICDKAIEILNDNKYSVDFSSVLISDKQFKGTNKFKRRIKCFIKRVMAKSKIIKKLFAKSKKIVKFIENEEFNKKMIDNNYSSKQEIETIQKKIEVIINDGEGSAVR